MNRLNFLKISVITMMLAGTSMGSALPTQKADAGQPGTFLDFAASARSLGMGRAYTAVADDAGAGYWNPAGLTQLDRKDVVALYSSLYEKTGFGFFSFAQPTLDYGTFGMSVVNVQSGDYEKVDSQWNKLGTFGITETALLLSNGYMLNDRLSIGGTLKAVQQTIDVYQARSFGLDMGGLWKIHPKFQAGAALGNLWAPTLKLNTASETYPRVLRIGFGYQPSPKWLIDLDTSKMQGRSIKLNSGVEWNPNNFLSLRAGLSESEIACGLGIRMGDWNIDYALGLEQAPAGLDSLGSSHRLGFHYKFGKKLSEEGASLKWQKRGQVLLKILEERANGQIAEPTFKTGDLIDTMIKVLNHQGFSKPAEILQAQGYIYFFKNNYGRSYEALSEALALAPGKEILARNVERARKEMTAEETSRLIAEAMKRAKELFDQGDYRGATHECNMVLSANPAHEGASLMLAEATRLLRKPIEEKMKIGVKKFNEGDFLAAISEFRNVKKLDPDNLEADSCMTDALAALEPKTTLNPTSPVETGAPKNEGIDPARSRALYVDGLVLYSKGQIKEAANLWEEAVKLDPNNALARSAYTRALIELKEVEKTNPADSSSSPKKTELPIPVPQKTRFKLSLYDD